MPVFEIQGVEGEAGLTTRVPIEAPDRKAALRTAAHQGLLEAHVVGLRDEEDDGAQAEVPAPAEAVEMSTEELLDKTGPYVRRRVLIGWLLLLGALPAAMMASQWVSSGLDWPMWLTLTIQGGLGLAIVIWAVQLFRWYWK